MSTHVQAAPVNRKFFTPGVSLLIVLAAIAGGLAVYRFIFGLSSITNLSDRYPWGLWIAVDVATGVALAAGGFTTAALTHIFHRGRYLPVVRPALLTAMLGYTFVGLGLMVDLGRYYNIWHPAWPTMWQGNSVLFEVGMCVMIYAFVLYTEFLPIVAERFIGRVNFKGVLLWLNKPLDTVLRALDRGLSKTMFIFIIAGVVLSTLHQSSLGTLMIIAGPKIHPLWQTPILPLLFLLSAVSVGFPMIIFESILASRSFGLKPEMDVLSRLGSFMAPILSIYLAFKIGDMVIRESFVYLTEVNTASVMFAIEIVIGIAIPLRMFLSPVVVRSRGWLFLAAALVVFGVLLNRINTFVVAYTPPYATKAYFPSIGEISVTVGFVSLLVLLYRFLAITFPVISVPEAVPATTSKYTIRGGRS